MGDIIQVGYIIIGLALICSLTYIATQLISKERKLLQAKMIKENQSIGIKIKLQSYERAVILCERMNLETLVQRVIQPGMNTLQLEAELIKTIRDEYNHNVSQQLYLSDAAWEKLEQARDAVITFVKKTARSLPKGSSALQFGELLLQHYANIPQNPIEDTIALMKQEVRQLIG